MALLRGVLPKLSEANPRRILVCGICLLLVVTSLFSAERPETRIRQVLKDAWYIKQLKEPEIDIASLTREVAAPGSAWHPAKMPAQVQEVLLERGLIPDPHVGKNAAKCDWVFENDWAYATAFDTPAGDGPVFLRFDGLDLIAAIYINGREVGRANNMYRRYSFEVRSLLNDAPGKNSLLVVFTGPVKELARIERDYRKVHNIAASKYLRKPNSDFNDYLGAKPNFMKVGIFADVTLDTPGETWIENLCVRTLLDDGYSNASLQLTWEHHGEPATVNYRLYAPDGKLAAEGSASSDGGAAGVKVNRPKLWWPHNHGAPNLYTLELDVTGNGKLQDTAKLKVGFRKVEQYLLDESSGQPRFGFKINGKLIFLKGVGWAPLEGMTQVWDRGRAVRQIDMGIQANMNLFRMWAGGNRPPQWFYDECDRKGVLVWQDFYIGHHAPPAHEPDFVENVVAEVEDMVKRLRNHPSIFVWVGGNENHMGWEFSNDYRPMPGRELFEKTMPAVVKEHDPTRPYHPSSPWGGPFSNYALQGDWHDYTTIKFVPLASVPLFGSELCRVSPPPVSSMRRYLTDEEIWPAGFDFKIKTPGEISWPPMWQYRAAGNAWDKIGRIERYCEPESAADLVRVLGTAHGDYLQDRIERQRRGVPDGAPDGRPPLLGCDDLAPERLVAHNLHEPDRLLSRTQDPLLLRQASI